MINRIINDAIGTVAKSITGRIGNFSLNGILIGVTVGGTAHAEANFDGHVVNVTLRQRKGENIQLVNSVRMTDFLKLSDFKGGFSLQNKGVATGRYCAYIPLARIRLEDDDVLEVAINCAGHATATYSYTVSACDLMAGLENLMGYELVQGNGAEQLIKDCYALYLTSGASGASITVTDSKGSVSLIDTDVIDLGNALGEMETYEDIGTLYSDPFDLSQDVRVKLPAGSFALAVKGFFDAARARERNESQDIDLQTVVDKIRAAKPEKIEALRLCGKL